MPPTLSEWCSSSCVCLSVLQSQDLLKLLMLVNRRRHELVQVPTYRLQIFLSAFETATSIDTIITSLVCS